LYWFWTALLYFLDQKNKRNFTPVLIGLEAERKLMYEQINQRVAIMMNLWLETKRLYPYKELNALQTVGYRELLVILIEISLEFVEKK
jgi:tRNA dimethylallyltransferase